MGTESDGNNDPRKGFPRQPVCSLAPQSSTVRGVAHHQSHRPAPRRDIPGDAKQHPRPKTYMQGVVEAFAKTLVFGSGTYGSHFVPTTPVRNLQRRRYKVATIFGCRRRLTPKATSPYRE